MDARDVTRILAGDDSGGPQAAEQLLALVYDELRKLAARRMAEESPGQTLQPTALVHEAYLRLVGGAARGTQWNGRGHFFAAAAEAMRRILVERARRVGRARHGGGWRRIDLDDLDGAGVGSAGAGGGSALDLIALDEALTRLEADDAGAAAVVQLRYFAGMTIDEAASALGISVRTANRHWAYARAWLYQQLGGEGRAGDESTAR